MPALRRATTPRLNKYIPYDPHPKQAGALLLNNVLELFYGGAAGGGKSDYLLMAALQYALSLDTVLPTPTGWTTMGDLCPGDELLDERGQITRVLQTHGVMENHECYRVVFSDGTEITADAGHLWSVQSFTDRMAEGQGYIRPDRVLSTKELAKDVVTKHKRPSFNWSVRATKPHDLPDLDLPLDPYILGVWLGDGHKGSGTIAGIDQEVREQFTAAGYATTTYNEHQWHVAGLRTELVGLGVFGEKRVPGYYLRASREQRLSLLQGLMDTDGSVDRKWGSCRFFNTDEGIARAVLELCRTLGWLPRISKQSYVLRSTGEKKWGWLVHFNADEPVFRIQRKRDVQKLVPVRRKMIHAVEPVESVPVQCITVDSPSHLFLAGDGHIPTHNCDVPNYAALILRKSYPDLAQPGAIMERSHKWLASTDAHWNGTDFMWTFPSGAKLKFGYLKNQDDKYQYDSSEYQFVGWDELTGFPEYDYTYLFSRLRRSDKVQGVPLRVRSASNPGGRGHEWVKTRFVDPKTREPGSVFIPARIEDNPSLTLEEYEASLAKMDPVERARKRAGNWDILEEGEMFKRHWFERVVEYPRDAKIVRYWDLASSKSDRKGNPDFTAGVLMAHKKGQYWILDVKHWRESPMGNELGIITTAEYDGPHVPIYFEQEPGAAGKIVADHYRRNVLPGYPVFFKPPVRGSQAGEDGKVERARPLSSATEAGNVHIIRGRWNEKYLDELTQFPNPDFHDDQVDASSGAHTRLAMRSKRTVRARSSSGYRR